MPAPISSYTLTVTLQAEVTVEASSLEEAQAAARQALQHVPIAPFADHAKAAMVDPGEARAVEVRTWEPRNKRR